MQLQVISTIEFLENLCISVHSFTKAWTFIPQVRTLYLLQLQLHKCLRLVSFDFSVYILYAVARNSDPLYILPLHSHPCHPAGGGAHTY